ncbi:MAG: 3'-5' exoribonuclease [Pleurocapsa minor GSE-CHR-MK-17-07R]|jgi:DNA polymerase-3 subunit epsilon/ATP-dependent DNA helicase DinG|nr:3'-5' exoribonuclease [Pleurocapsa minor GSE-CHR-MK 17-07R]
MRGVVVAVDLETTGLYPTVHDIIEIGAVRFEDGVATDEFKSFVKPRNPENPKDPLIPKFITELTGITDDDVANAPPMREAVDALEAFTGRDPIVGHSVAFDLGFLNQRQACLLNPRIDTYELASMLVPGAPRYNLGSLAAWFNVPLASAHRALDDARASGLVYFKLWELLLQVPPAILLEINYLSADIANWDARYTLQNALRELGIQPNTAYFPAPVFTESAPDVERLDPLDIDGHLDVAAMEALFSPGSPLSGSLPDYEDRAQQRNMALAVTRAFNDGAPVMIEAGTGTGKSMAYLVPSIAWALHTGERVVISTGTINLQEQLLNKDIPALRHAFDTPFNAVLLKGRNNYLCPRRFEFQRKRKATSLDELRIMAKILIWTLSSKSGDRGEISLRGAEEYTWTKLNSQDEGCTDSQCSHHMHGVCPLHKARKAAQAAHVIVVNHALLTADAVTGHTLLPDFTRVVLDEAHQFEDAVTNSQTFRIDEPTLRRQLSEIGSLEPSRGLLGAVTSRLSSANAADALADFLRYAHDLSDVMAFINAPVSKFFKSIQTLMTESGGGGDYNQQMRFTPKVRESTAFSAAANSASSLAEYLDAIAIAVKDLALIMTQAQLAGDADIPELISSMNSLGRDLAATTELLIAVFKKPDSNFVYWLAGHNNNEFASLNGAPIYVGQHVQESLLQHAQTVVMTSATLQVNNSFDYIQQRMGCDGVETIDVGSPFDYKASTLLYIPNDMPPIAEKFKYQQALERAIIEVAAALQGRTMVLLTSYTQLKQTAQAITPRLKLGDIAVYDQSDGSSRQSLLDGFKQTERAVLLGTRSFWEGVDVPGDSLSALIITKLPFAVPTDPIVAARSETYGSPFDEYSLPDAVLRFRQGFGRLIRTRTDRGVVVVLDSRVLNKGYGMRFIDALPQCTMNTGPLKELAGASLNWIRRP